MPVEWDKLRSWNETQWAAFEELICQLARYEYSPLIGEFVRKGIPDAGVECFWKFTSGEEHGWQAKFFKSQPSSSRWRQIDSSVKRALEKHPKLQQYTICMAFDPPDSRRKDTTSFDEQWKARVAKWESWATEKGMCVKFDRWGTSEIFERLFRDEHRSMHFFWFNEELFTPTWFGQRLEEVIAAVGPRYTPDLNVRLPLSDLFEGLSRSPVFFEHFQKLYGDIGKQWSKDFLKPIETAAPEHVESFYQQLEQIIQTAKCYDKPGMEPIDWAPMVCQVKNALKHTSEINCLLTDAINQCNPHETRDGTGKSSKREHLNYAQHKLLCIEEKLQGLRAFIESEMAKVASKSAMLLCGEAGTGKTHLFADAAKNHLESGCPSILLLGNRFTKREPWSQMLRMLDLTCTREEFLSALASAAQTAGRRAIIFIDALNEGEGRCIWKTYLPSILECLARYPWVAIAISVRSTYENLIMPDDLAPDKIVRCIHNGFVDREYQAAKAYFSFYNIQMPSVPILAPEFQNPLFLRCLCRGLENSKLTEIPLGIRGISSVFRFFQDSVNEKLAVPEMLDYDPKCNLVDQALRELAAWLSREGVRAIPRAEAKAICGSIHPQQGFEFSLFRHLLSEGILAEMVSYEDGGNPQEMITFSYERLADHLILRELLNKLVNPENPAEAFADGPLNNYLKDKISYRHNRGLLEALAIQGPETLEKEIFELIPEFKNARLICEAFIESLLWRDPRTISSKCLQYINEYVMPDDYLRFKFLNAILTIAPDPKHAFNADLLHRHLMKFEMAQRDAWWSIFLHDEYVENGAVDRLIDWAWSDTDKAYISDESVRLVGTALVWFLTTSHRFLRDCATKALVSLFTNRIDVLCKVIRKFAEVNDLYVSERLYAVAYGCALRSNDPDAKLSLAQLVYDTVFKDGNPPCHILLRDYARGVVEVALHDGMDLEGVKPQKIRPPYRSEWPLQIPSEEEVQEFGKLNEEMSDEQWAFRLIYNSVMDFGDFARYIIGNHIPWTERRLGEENPLSRKEKLDAFVASLTDRQKTAWKSYLEIRDRPRFSSLDGTGLSDLSEESLPHESDSTLAVSQAERRFRRTLGKRKERVFSEVVLPYLDAPPAEKDEFALPSSIAQRWILQRVRDLGWTEDRFGRFDQDLEFLGNPGRGTTKPERMGKKYQWIAYHEFLAHLADNLEFRKDSWSEEPAVYDGPWQLSLRDIDPSSLLKSTRRSKWEPNVTTWWVPAEFHAWTDEKDDTQWLKRPDLLPEIALLPVVTDSEDGREWFVLECTYDWEEPTPPEKDRLSLRRRHIWIMLKSYLVKSVDEERFCDWAKDQHFMDRWMPESHEQSNIFLGEFFWAPAFNYFNTSYYGHQGWTKNGRRPLPCKVLVTADEYLHERGYDCSIEDTISMYLPAKWIADKMNLSWSGEEDCYFSSEGQLVAQDPSVRTQGCGALLMDKNFVSEFLESEGYRLVWTLLGGKSIRGSWKTGDHCPSRMEFSGYMRMRAGQLSGEATMYWDTQESDLKEIARIDIPPRINTEK